MSLWVCWLPRHRRGRVPVSVVGGSRAGPREWGCAGRGRELGAAGQTSVLTSAFGPSGLDCSSSLSLDFPAHKVGTQRSLLPLVAVRTEHGALCKAPGMQPVSWQVLAEWWLTPGPDALTCSPGHLQTCWALESGHSPTLGGSSVLLGSKTCKPEVANVSACSQWGRTGGSHS